MRWRKLSTITVNILCIICLLFLVQSLDFLSRIITGYYKTIVSWLLRPLCPDCTMWYCYVRRSYVIISYSTSSIDVTRQTPTGGCRNRNITVFNLHKIEQSFLISQRTLEMDKVSTADSDKLPAAPSSSFTFQLDIFLRSCLQRVQIVKFLRMCSSPPGCSESVRQWMSLWLPHRTEL